MKRCVLAPLGDLETSIWWYHVRCKNHGGVKRDSYKSFPGLKYHKLWRLQLFNNNKYGKEIQWLQ